MTEISLVFIRSFNADYQEDQGWVIWSPSLCKETGCPSPAIILHCLRLDISVIFDSIVSFFHNSDLSVSELSSDDHIDALTR